MGPMNRAPWEAQDYLEAFRRERPGAGARERNWEVLEQRLARSGSHEPEARRRELGSDPRRMETEVLELRSPGKGRRRRGAPSSSGSPMQASREPMVPRTADVRLVAAAIGVTLAIAAAVLLVIGGIGRGLQAARQLAEPAMQAVDEPAPAPPREVVPRRSAPAVQTVDAPVPAPVPATQPSARRRVQELDPTAATPEPAPASSPEALAEQTRLLAHARQALADDDPAEALKQLEQLGERFPAGALDHERRAYDAIARCRLEPPTKDAATRFLAEHPASPHGPRVRAACAISP